MLGFGTDSVAVVLEWTWAHENGLSYIVETVPQVNITFQGTVSFQLQVLYNIVYNVSIKSSLCGQTSVILKFSKFKAIILMMMSCTVRI